MKLFEHVNGNQFKLVVNEELLTEGNLLQKVISTGALMASLIKGIGAEPPEIKKWDQLTPVERQRVSITIRHKNPKMTNDTDIKNFFDAQQTFKQAQLTNAAINSVVSSNAPTPFQLRNREDMEAVERAAEQLQKTLKSIKHMEDTDSLLDKFEETLKTYEQQLKELEKTYEEAMKLINNTTNTPVGTNVSPSSSIKTNNPIVKETRGSIPHNVIEMFERIKSIAKKQKRYAEALRITTHDSPELVDQDMTPWWDIGIPGQDRYEDVFITFSNETGWTYGDIEEVLDNNKKMAVAIQKVINTLPPMRI